MNGLVDHKGTERREGGRDGISGGGRNREEHPHDAYHSNPYRFLPRTYLSFARLFELFPLGPPPPPPRLGAGAAVGRVVLILLPLSPPSPRRDGGRREGLSSLALLLELATTHNLLQTVVGVVAVGRRTARRLTRGSIMETGEAIRG